LFITTSPSGATVYIDGEVKGVTPATVPGLSEGKHSVLLVLAGYTSLNATINVNTGKTAEYSTGLSKPEKTPGFAVIGAALSLGVLLVYRKTRK
jgi:LPXTG-motif cell wall-anchored protein